MRNSALSTEQVVVCAGIVVADVILRPFSGLPEPGGLKLVERIGLYSGGCAANTALTLARVGVPTEVVASVGQDEFGEFLVRTLAGSGVGVAGVVRSPELGTSTTVVLVAADGERSFLHTIGANAGLHPEHFPAALLHRCRILHFGGALLLPGFDGPPMAEVLCAARAAGALTSLDTAQDHSGRWYSTLATCLPELDVFMTSEREGAAIAGRDNPQEAASFLLDRGARFVAIKLGQRGCLVASAGERHRLPAFSVPVVDTTGAGDAFAAGFLAGLAAGRDLRSCGLLGCAAGARCVSHPGAAAFPVSMDDLLSLAQL